MHMSVARFILAATFVCGLLANDALAAQRVALVVGNGAYKYAGALANPTNDAADIADVLKAHGFNVILGSDLDKRGLETKIRDFARALTDADAAVFFYAGHGLQVDGQNYLVPIDARLDNERDLDFETVRVDFVLRQMELQRETKTNIVFLDACRDNPLARNLARSMGTRSASIGQGLAQIEAGVGTFIAFSTQPGNVALDGKGRNSPFAAALTKRIAEAGRNLNAIMIEVRKDVLAATAGKQVPWDHSALTGDFFFDLAAAGHGLRPSRPPASEAEAQTLNERIKKLEDELRRKADSERSAELLQLKERGQLIEETNREDWQRIFELRRKAAQETNSERRRELESEAMRIQLKITRRGLESRKLAEQIRQLEETMGLAVQGAGGPVD
jgi:hypothetical protein